MKKLFLTVILVMVLAVGNAVACGWECYSETGQGFVDGNTSFSAWSGNGNVYVASDNNFVASSKGRGYRFVHGYSSANAGGFGYDDYDFGFLFADAHSYGSAWVSSNADAGADGWLGRQWAYADVSGLAHQNNFATANPFDFEGITIAMGGNWSTAEYDGFVLNPSNYYPHVYIHGSADVYGYTDVHAYDFGPIAGADTYTTSMGYAYHTGWGFNNVSGGGMVAHSALADNNEWGGTPGNWAFTGAMASYGFDNTNFCGPAYGSGYASTSGDAFSFSTYNSVSVGATTSASAGANTGGGLFWYVD